MKYTIYQIKNIGECDYAFRSWESAEDKFDFDDYKEVYSGEVNNSFDHPRLLEGLWVVFNMRRPSDFTGHSISVSDVVLIDGISYYCDDVGWKIIRKGE